MGLGHEKGGNTLVNTVGSSTVEEVTLAMPEPLMKNVDVHAPPLPELVATTVEPGETLLLMASEMVTVVVANLELD